MHSTQRMFAVAVLAVLPSLSGCGREGTSAPANEQTASEPENEATEEKKSEASGSKDLWRQLVPDTEPRFGTQHAVVRVGPEGVEHERQHLEGIRLADSPSKSQVRVYVGAILRAASHKKIFGNDDPEVELLAQVGTDHVDVLMEPLVYLEFLNGGNYLIEALKTLVTNEHKGLVLERLTAAPDLIELVVARKWTADAAPALFKALAKREPHLNTDWVEAAAPLAQPEHYDDLKFYLRNGSNSYSVWEAIRHLPGIEPIEPAVVSAWQGTSREDDPWRWGQLATVAAHYGHMAGLEFIVVEMEQYEPAWKAFQRLTGYGLDIEFPWSEDLKKARAWFAAKKARLEFDRATGRYVVRKP